MTTPQFIEWLNGKMRSYKKLIPPADVIEAELVNRVETKLRDAVSARILKEAGYENQVAAAVAAFKKPGAKVLRQGISRLFEQEPHRQWRDYIEIVASRSQK